MQNPSQDFLEIPCGILQLKKHNGVHDLLVGLFACFPSWLLRHLGRDFLTERHIACLLIHLLHLLTDGVAVTVAAAPSVDLVHVVNPVVGVVFGEQSMLIFGAACLVCAGWSVCGVGGVSVSSNSCKSVVRSNLDG